MGIDYEDDTYEAYMRRRDSSDFRMARPRRYVMGFLFSMLLSGIIAIAGAVLLIEWAAGCGERSVDRDGVHHEVQCVFMR